MVRQGGYKLRFHGQLQLVVATFLTLVLASSVAAPLYAETAETATSPSQGFNRTSSYYSQVTTLRYITAPDVEKVQFVIYDTDTPENLTADRIDTLTAEDVSAEGQEGYKTWKVSEVPSEGVMLMVQVKQGGETWEYAETDTIDIAPPPTLSLAPYGERKGGSTLPVNGSFEGKLLEGAKLNARLVATGGQERASASATHAGKDISTHLSLPENLDGEYTVELSLTHSGLKITQEQQLVSLMTHKPAVQMRLSQDPPYANEAFEIYASSSMTRESLAGMTLTYAGQVVEMTAQGDGSYVYNFPLGLSSDTYEFKIVARDVLGNSNQNAPAVLQKFLVLRVITSPKNDKGLLPVVPLKPVATLSTDFAPLLTPRTRVNDSKDKRDEADRAFVLGAETEKLKEVVNLNENKEEVDAPIDTSSTGWKMLGVPWYLWVTGGVTAWGGMFAARWWFRRG